MLKGFANVTKFELKDGMKPTDIVFKDFFSEHTRRTRKTLLILASVLVLLSIEGLSLKRFVWFEVDDFEHTRPIILGATTLGLVYFYLSFLIYSWHDFRQWRSTAQIYQAIQAYGYLLQIHATLQVLNKSIAEIAAAKLPLSNDIDQKIKYFVGSGSKFYEDRLSKAGDDLARVFTEQRNLKFGQWIKLSTVDLGFPVLVGAFAIEKNSHLLAPFLRLVIG
ncbi:hypothetical protein GCM10008110_28470 [Marinobacter persicus]|nr:hypothetical protein GCM10008110_28470 [Marinobacter persicus]